MKKILFFLLLLSSVAYGQTTYFIRADSTRLEKVGGNNELILLNATRGVAGGVLTNIGNGRTAFVLPGTLNTIYNANDSITANRIAYVSGVSFPTRTLTFSQNSSTNNTTNQPMSAIFMQNRFFITKTAQAPGTIPDNFSPFVSVGRLAGSGTVNYSGVVSRYRPLSGTFVGGFTNSTAATFNNATSATGATSVVSAEWQTDRTASQTITGWTSGFKSSLQFGEGAFPLPMENHGQFIASTPSYSTRGTLGNLAGFYAAPQKTDSVAKAYAFYNEGTADSNYYAGPVRMTNLPDSDSTSAKPVGRLANGTLVDLPYWPGSGGGGGIINLVPTVASVTTATTITEPTDNREKTYVANATSGAIAFTAAVSPTNGQIINIFKSDASGNAVTITTVEGAQSITTQNAGWRLQYITALSGYKIISSF